MAEQDAHHLHDPDDDPVEGTPLRLLGLSVRTFNTLTVNGIRTLEDLDQWSDRDLLTIYHLGRRGVAEARAAAVRWQGQDHLERMAYYLRRRLPRQDRERLAALLTGVGDGKDESATGREVTAIGHAIGYFDRQVGGAIDPGAMDRIADQVRPGLLRIREAVEAAERSLDRALRREE